MSTNSLTTMSTVPPQNDHQALLAPGSTIGAPGSTMPSYASVDIHTVKVSPATKNLSGVGFVPAPQLGMGPEDNDYDPDIMHMQERSPAYRVLHEHKLLSMRYRVTCISKLDLVQATSSAGKNFCKRGMLCLFGIVPGIADSMVNSQFLVPDGQLRCATDSNTGKYMFFGPGVHRYYNPFLSLGKFHKLTESFIKHGNRTIVTIPQGQIGFAMDRGQPVLLPPGMHQWCSNTLIYERNLDLSDHVIELGPYTLLTVDQGYAAVTQDNGEQRILAGGNTYMLTHRNWRFEKFLTEKIQTNDLRKIRATTADNIHLETTATVIWRIKDVARAALNAAETMHADGKSVQGEDIAKLRQDVLQQAIASVSAFIGKVRYSEGEAVSAAIDTRASANSSDHVTGVPVDEDTSSTARLSGGKLKAYDTNKLSNMGGAGFLFDQSNIKNCVVHANGICDRYGVEIMAINIISAFPTNEKLTSALAAGAVAAAEAEQMELSAQGRAKAMFIDANAQAEAVRIRARADGDAERARAKGIKDAAETIESSQVAINLQTIDKTGKAIGTNKTFFFGADATQMNNLLQNPKVVQ